MLVAVLSFKSETCLEVGILVLVSVLTLAVGSDCCSVAHPTKIIIEMAILKGKCFSVSG